VSGAGNQQERPAIEAINVALGSFLSGFALGEGSLMIVCRRRSGSARGFRLSAAFNVSQHDRAPLDVFRETLGCGTMRVAGNGGWYWEVNGLADQRERIVPFFERFALVGQKAEDFELYRRAIGLLSQPPPQRLRLPRGSGSPGTDEPRREEEVPDGRNPQRLYADLTVSMVR
jgi:LAGLIDADG endonuclease